MNQPPTLLFGTFDPEELEKVQESFFHSENIFTAVMDKDSLHDPATIDQLLARFPANLMRDFDIFLILAECIANAVSYSDTRLLGLHARRRGKLLLFSIYHVPIIAESVDYVIRNAHDGWLPDFENDPPSGLGFPILFRLAYQVTITADRTRLQLWVRLHNNVV